MENELLFVLDETGTTNYPQNDLESDYAVAGIVFHNDEADKFVTAGRKLAKITHKSDFKYRHVQRNPEARKYFLSTIRQLKSPSGVYGFYSQGGSLLAEKDRSIQAQKDIDGTIDSKVLTSAEAIRSGSRQESLASFYSYFAACVFPYAGANQCKIRVIMDRRNDLGGLQEACNQEATNFTNHPKFGNISERVVFDEVGSGVLSNVVRLAGVVAGDIRMFFNCFREEIGSKLPAEPLTLSARDIPSLTPEESEQLTLVERVNGKLGHENFMEASRETGMIRGYSDRFLAHNLSFAFASGVMGYLYIPSDDLWELHRTPDVTFDE